MDIPKSVRLITLILGAQLLAACSDKEQELRGTIAELLAAHGEFTVLVAAMDRTGLTAVLDEPSSALTLSAPTDAAFEKLSPSELELLMADTAVLAEVLKYYIVNARLSSAAAKANGTFQTLNGEYVAYSVHDSSFFINKSSVVIKDIDANNGIIHGIDAVLMPPKSLPSMEVPITLFQTLADDARFTILVTALEATQLDFAYSNVASLRTVFAPTDDAFRKLDPAVLTELLADIPALNTLLLRHTESMSASPAVHLYTQSELITGGGRPGVDEVVSIEIDPETDTMVIGGATVIEEDVHAAGGVIHVIDSVIGPIKTALDASGI